MGLFFKEHESEIFRQYTTEELKKDIWDFRQRGGKLTKLLNHFFKRNIYSAASIRGKKTPMEALQCDEDMEVVLDYIKSKPNFYTGDLVTNVESFFRNGGKIACKVANFDPTNVRDMLESHGGGENRVVLDTSMGFGSRMVATILGGDNYIGIDPNKELYEQLKKCLSFLKGQGFMRSGQYARIYCQGSEETIVGMDNTCDLMMTSPPYFNMEKYSEDGKSSTSNYDNYPLWLKEFAKPTIYNIHRYLKVGGIAMINIKNLTYGKNEPLYDDWHRIFVEHGGYEEETSFKIQHQAKKQYFQNSTYGEDEYSGFEESVMTFKKTKDIQYPVEKESVAKPFEIVGDNDKLTLIKTMSLF